MARHCQPELLAFPAVASGCDCPPCPGRGNDGHGMAHCAECCFGSGVLADEDCPVHGRAAFVSEPPNIADTCCGACPGGTCYVDQVTGA